MLFNENLFLIVLGLVWILGAVIQDLRRREVDNLWNFSLIAFALAYRLSFSVFSNNYWYFVNGILGLAIFLLIGNLMYYGRMFAGGDAKLLIALGAILPLSYNWIVNFKFFGLFILLFFITGAIYVFIWSLFLVIFNFRKFLKEFIKQFKIYKIIFLASLIFAASWLFLIFFNVKFIWIGLMIILFPILFVYSKAIEESCLIKLVSYKKVTEGDWLYGDIKIGRKLIKADWEGVSEEQIRLIRKNKKNVLVKYGVPFTPSFLFGFIALLFLIFKYPVVFN